MNNEIIHFYNIIDKQFNDFDKNIIENKIQIPKKDFWIHLDGNNLSIKDKLEEYGIPDFEITNTLLAEETRPLFAIHKKGLLIILRGLDKKDANNLDTFSIRMWIEENKIVSIQKKHLISIDELKNYINDNENDYTIFNIFFLIIKKVLSTFDEICIEMEENIDLLEENFLENNDLSQREKIIEIQKKSILFRRYLNPQKKIFSELLNQSGIWLNDEIIFKFREFENQTSIQLDMLNSIRERSQNVKEEIANSFAEKINKNMLVLSIISIIFLPLTFLTGLMGSNIGGIPGSSNDLAFWIFLVILLVISIFQILIFKKLKLI